jgi:energy-coupling factor transport system permease protein
MQDPRLRLLAVVAISITAFSGIAGAFLAALWYLTCTRGPGMLRRSSWPLVAFIPLLLVTAAIWITGGEWLSYLVRLGVVILVAIYAYQDQKPGQFIQVCTWAFGPGVGFDLGLAGEMAVSSIRFLGGEVQRVRQAYLLKSSPIGARALSSIATNLVFGLLRRAEDQADLLFVRGYGKGGVSCAKFSSSRRDFIAAGVAFLLFLLCFFPVREFFILAQ